MKQSGINYFFNNLDLPTGSFGVYYTFGEGAGVNIASVSGAQSGYSGTLSSSTNFWPKPGSGYSSGTSVIINNSSGLHSEAWTKILVYEKINVQDCVLFDSLTGGSGHRIGITKANKPYFESFNTEPVVAASLNNYSSKNAISVSYLPNSVTLGLYNFNAQEIESEEFNYAFQVTRSDAQRLGGQYTGWWDSYIHYTDYLSPQVIGQWLSGLYSRPTGVGYDIQTNCTTGVTGYQTVFVGETGITGYQTTYNGDEGRDYYTGAFPLSHTSVPMTGYLSSGLYSSGVIGQVCYPITGGPIDLLEYQTGYALSFGMQKIQMFTPLISTDLVKTSWDLTPFNDIYNELGQRQYSGYQMVEPYPSGLLDAYYNGIALANFGYILSGNYLLLSGAVAGDIAFWDLKSGDKRTFTVTPPNTGFYFNYSGQEIYLNGVNLISGYDFLLTGAVLNITYRNTGVAGTISEYPIVLPFQTGLNTLVTGGPFQCDTSNVYLNGVRQQIDSLYVEGATYDLLSGNRFDYSGVTPIYGNNNLFWEF